MSPTTRPECQADTGQPRTTGDNQSVLVTGATAGFGLAIARRFAQAGHTIVAAGRHARHDLAIQSGSEAGEQVSTIPAIASA